MAGKIPMVTIIKKELNYKNYTLNSLKSCENAEDFDELKFQRRKSQWIECSLALRVLLMTESRLSIRYGPSRERRLGARDIGKS